jgi:hypothetical protein
VLSRGKQTPNPDGQKSTSGNVHSRHEPCPFDFPSTEFRYRASTPPGLHYASGVPLCHVHFGTSRIAEYSAPSLLLLESPIAESPTLRIRATCPSRNRRSRSNRGIALRDFNVHGILALPNSDSPIRDGQGFLRCLRVNTLSPSSRSNDPLDSAGLHDDSVRRFFSSMKRSPLRHLPSV